MPSSAFIIYSFSVKTIKGNRRTRNERTSGQCEYCCSRFSLIVFVPPIQHQIISLLHHCIGVACWGHDRYIQDPTLILLFSVINVCLVFSTHKGHGMVVFPTAHQRCYYWDRPGTTAISCCQCRMYIFVLAVFNQMTTDSELDMIGTLFAQRSSCKDNKQDPRVPQSLNHLHFMLKRSRG